MTEPRDTRRSLRRALFATGLAVGAATAAVAAERYVVRRARARPDPEREEPFAERPGVEHRVRSFDGTELAVNVVGPEDGPTLVFVHGFSLDVTAWHYQWKRFSGGYRCVLYDQRGHGRSGRAAGGDYSVDALGRDLGAVLEAHAPTGPVVLVGHSMGGMSILSFAAHHPPEFEARVRGVVLASTAAAEVVKEILGGLLARVGRLLVPTPAMLRRAPHLAYRMRVRALARSPDLAFLAVRLTNFGPQAPPSVVDHVAAIAAQTPAEVWIDLALSLAEMDLGHALDHVTVPALVIVGDVDRLTPPSTALAIKRRLPAGRMVVLRGAGHCAMLERHEQWNRVVERFVREAFAREPARAAPP